MEPVSENIDGAASSDLKNPTEHDGLEQEPEKTAEKTDLQVVEDLFSGVGGFRATFKDKFENFQEQQNEVTPLVLAAALGKNEIVKELLEEAKQTSEETIKEQSMAFFIASQEGHLDIMKIIANFKNEGQISHLLKTRQGPFDQTPLLVASWKARLQVVKYLLELGADINDKDSTEQTVLHLAAANHTCEVIETLLQTESSLLDKRDEQDRTPLLIAACYGRKSALEALHRSGATIEAFDDTKYTALHLATAARSLDCAKYVLGERPDLLDKKSHFGDTALMIASQFGMPHIVELLLLKKADCTIVNEDDMTALHLAAREGHLDIVKSLLRADRAPLEMRNKEKETPLLLASANGHFGVLEHLLEQGASPAARDKNDQTALHIAATERHFTMAQALVGKQKSILNLTNDRKETAMIIAASKGNLQIVELLTQSGADDTIRDIGGETALQVAVNNGYLDITQHLLDNCSVDIHEMLELENSQSYTPIVTAVCNRELEIADYLIKKGANIQHRDNLGRNVLTNAYLAGAFEVKEDAGLTVEYLESLLERRVEITPDHEGRNVLHFACYAGDHKVIQTILNWSSDDSEKGSSRQQATVAAAAAKDISGDTPLADALAEKRILAILVFLSSKACFPELPCTAIPFLCSDEDIGNVSDFLMKFLLPNCEFTVEEQEEFTRRRESVLYWAFLNGQKRLIDAFLEVHTDVSWHRIRNVPLMHVAALGGQTHIIQPMLERMLESQQFQLEAGYGRITALHLAVKHKHMALVELILKWLDKVRSAVNQTQKDTESPQKCIDPGLTAVIKTTENEETPLSLAAFGGTDTHGDIEEVLWKYLLKCIDATPNFFSLPLTEEAQRVLEVAAQVEPPREENYLRGFLRKVPAGLLGPPEGSNTLYLAVYHRCATVIWWLLSNGGYTSEIDIKKGLEISSKRNGPRDWLDKIIVDVLRDPPPVRKRRGRRDDHHEPRFTSAIPKHVEMEGNIVDLLVDEENEITFSFKYRPISEIIYTDGPKKIMTVTKDRDLYSLKEKLAARDDKSGISKIPGPKSKSPSWQRLGIDSVAPFHGSVKEARKEGPEKQKEGQGNEQEKQRGLRWIHIPENNLRYIEDLMVRISLDKGIKNKDHRPLARFVTKSWAELPAGRMKAYMKPQCVYDNEVSWKSSGKKEEGVPKQWLHSGKRVALYMPYISWDRWPERAKSDAKAPVEVASRTASKEAVVHEAMTLDQYYYTSLKNTDRRDRDQAIWRLLVNEHLSREKEKCENYKLDMENQAKEKLNKEKFEWQEKLHRSRHESAKDVPETKDLSEKPAIDSDAAAFKILTVDQLWLWVVDEKTVITSTTKKSDGIKRSFFQKVLSAIRAQEKNTQLSIGYLTEIILMTATGSFNRKDIEIFELEKSPLDVYRESILNAREIEATLFDEFRSSLPQSNMKKRDLAPRRSDQELSDNAKRQKAWCRDLLHRRRPRAKVSSGQNMTQQSHRSGGQLREDKEPSIQHQKDREQDSRDETSSETSGNQFGDIAREADLLREVKDIIDELNMLKNLAEDQEDVWQQVWNSERNPDASFTYDTPTEVKDDISEMINEAKSVQQAIDTLLDLKQKQANIAEAQSTRKQSDTVMVFTVITILFLPASFLASIFALNVSDYPHENGNVTYKGRWIFPIIIFVSLAISGIFSLIAFYWTTWREIYNKWKKGRDLERKQEKDAAREPLVRSKDENV